MGIPKFFRWVTNKYDNLIIEKVDNINNLFLDTNCLIHPCCQKVLKNHQELIAIHYKEYKSNNELSKNYGIYTKLELKMFEEITEYIKYLYNFTNPSKLLYISIDGVAPRAKMEQQRKRRYRSYKEKQMKNAIYNKYGENIYMTWDSTAITPGTIFMTKLSQYLQKNMCALLDNKAHIILSDTCRPGEGEHKIVQYIKNNCSDEDIHSIYGLDADLIMLALCLDSKVYLLREAVQFGKIDTETLLFMSIPEFKEALFSEISRNIDCTDFELDKQSLINDYVFLCFLIGNDFLPKMITLDIDHNSITDLINIYINLLNIRKKYLVQNLIINYSFLQQILSCLYNKEDKYLAEIQRKYTNKKVYSNNRYSSQCEKEIENLKYYPITNKISPFRYSDEGWRESYYKYYFNIIKVNSSKENISQICSTYVEGLQWNVKYYFDKCPSWKWFYPYRAAPILRDLCQYFNNRIYEVDFGISEPYNPIEQLCLVIPKYSSHLLPENISKLLMSDNPTIALYYPDKYNLDLLNNYWFHECDPILPILNDGEVLDEVCKINLTDYEKVRTYNGGGDMVLVNKLNNISLSIDI